MIDPERYPRKRMTLEERRERLRVLECRLPKITAGFGIYREERTIATAEASTHQQWEDAHEREQIIASFFCGRSINNNLLIAVSWARSVFHSHGFPSRCWVYYSRAKGNWLLLDAKFCRAVNDRHFRELDRELQSEKAKTFFDKRPCAQIFYRTYFGIMRIETAIRWGYIPEADYGSPLYVANQIIMAARQVASERPSRDSELSILIADAFRAGEYWGDIQARALTENDALAKRAEREANRKNARRGGERARELAAERRHAWFAHLDQCSQRRRWLMLPDRRKWREAYRSFHATIASNPDLTSLFGALSPNWFEREYEEWQTQAIEEER